jgi:hypothetical protein
MAPSDDFYATPGSQLEPGDIFPKIPLPILKYPLSYFRIRANEPKTATLFDMEHGDPQAGKDSPKSSVELRAVMLVSHGCEVDRVIRQEPPERRHWLAAPIHPLKDCSEKTQQRTRDRIQPNRFYLPPSPCTGGQELCVDLRKITPINCKYFLDAERSCAISEVARKALFSLLGVFFSGYALYLQSIPCPNCGAEIDPSRFRVPSGEEPDID